LAALRLHEATDVAELHTADSRHLQIATGYEGNLRGSFCERGIWLEGCSYLCSDRFPHFTLKMKIDKMLLIQLRAIYLPHLLFPLVFLDTFLI